MIFVAGISIAVFFEFLLISKKNKSASDKILILWMFLISIHLFLFYLYFTKEIYNFPFLLGVELPLPLLHGVLLYFYVSSMTNQLPKNKNILLLNCLPIILAYLYLSINFFPLPAAQKIQVYQHNGAGYEVFNTILYYTIILSGVIYVFWSSLLLRKHRQNILNQFSDLEKVNLQWLQILTWGIGGIWLVVIFIQNDLLIFGGAAVFVFLIGFFGIRQVGIFTTNQMDYNNDQEAQEAPKDKYAKSGLTAELSDKLYQALIRLMTEEAIYQKNDLSVNDLAIKLNVHPNYLSQIINEREGKNFYDFINTYRIEAFKNLIADPKNQRLTLLALAYDCGFNSKSSFNRHFKKATGQTPSEYFAALTKA